MPAVEAPPAIRTLADLIDRLGGISPDRIRFQPPPGTATAKDLLRINGSKDGQCELVDGVLVEKAMGYSEAFLSSRLVILLSVFVDARNLGLVTGEGGQMRLFKGLVRIPDVAFVSWERIPDRKVPAKPVPRLVPNLAVEILSRGNTPREMKRKRQEYFRAGVELMWIVDPRKRTVTVFTSADDSLVLTDKDTLDGGKVLPGFKLSLAKLFAELDRTGN